MVLVVDVDVDLVVVDAGLQGTRVVVVVGGLPPLGGLLLTQSLLEQDLPLQLEPRQLSMSLHHCP